MIRRKSRKRSKSRRSKSMTRKPKKVHRTPKKRSKSRRRAATARKSKSHRVKKIPKRSKSSKRSPKRSPKPRKQNSGLSYPDVSNRKITPEHKLRWEVDDNGKWTLKYPDPSTCEYALGRSIDPAHGDTVYTFRPDGDLIRADVAVRGFPSDLSGDEMCWRLRQEVPPFEWEHKMLQWIDSLSEREKLLIAKYVHSDVDLYVIINTKLRKNPDSPAPINAIIAKAPPLPSDIVVYRYMDRPRAERMKGTFNFLGYLSTTLSGELVSKTICSSLAEHTAIARIRVPKGMKCIYENSQEEFELLFPHKTELKVLGKRKLQIKCLEERGPWGVMPGRLIDNMLVVDIQMIGP